MIKTFLALALVFLTAGGQETVRAQASAKMEEIGLAPDKLGFVCLPSGRVFHPWGNNYGNKGGLIEDFWESDWGTVTRDFQEMKSMGANVVRVHLQFGRFMLGPDKPNSAAMLRLAQLLQLAEATGLYLDVTGLACYRKADVPPWYDALPEAARWAAQTRFWEGVAAQCSNSPAIFCYDLINEPVVAGGRRNAGDWYSGELGGLNFIQFINLDQGPRSREKIARQWVDLMTAAIHQHDQRHLITIGMLPTTPQWGLFSGFDPRELAPVLDFISVHIYPEKDKLGEALSVVQRFDAGKPVVIEETFPLSCSAQELKTFLIGSRRNACGWIGHYNGESIADLKALEAARKMSIAQSLWLAWEQLFKELAPVMTKK